MTFDFSSKKELIAWLTNCSSHDAELEQFDFDSKTQTVRAAFSNPCFQNIRYRLLFEEVSVLLYQKKSLWKTDLSSGSRSIIILCLDEKSATMDSLKKPYGSRLDDSLCFVLQLFCGDEIRLIAKSLTVSDPAPGEPRSQQGGLPHAL